MFGSKRAAFARSLRRGDTGEDVRRLQALLRDRGHDPGPIDGNFGSGTHTAVVEFQSNRGLVPDGVAGPTTVALLSATESAAGGSKGQSPTGLSLHIGLNHVNDSAYGFAVPPLAGCVNDASDMESLALGRNFRTRMLLNEEATSSAVIESIESAAEILADGDILWISYSGHGSQIPDPIEDDGLSETWVLWDRQLIDDELYALWGRFHPGVRVLLISDSCHSGTVSREFRLLISEITRAVQQPATRDLDGASRMADGHSVLTTDSAVELALALGETVPTLLQQHGISRSGAARTVVSEVMNRVVSQSLSSGVRDLPFVETPRLLALPQAARDASRRTDLYREIATASVGSLAPECSVLLISGCQDNQTSSDGNPDPSGHQNGAFTKLLRQEWASATDYPSLHSAILTQLPPTQSPNLFWATERDVAFESQLPFTI